MAGLITKTQKTAKDMARAAARRTQFELNEYAKDVARQTIGQNESAPKNKENLTVPTPPIDKNKMANEEIGKLDYLEKELEKLRQEKKIQAQKEVYMEEMQKEENDKKQTIIIPEPTSKPKRGLFGVKKKQGTKEMGKHASG